MNDEFFMRLALDEAWKYQLLTYPNPAVGAVVVQNGRILSIEAHQKAGTSHAEVLALIGAYKTISDTTVNFDRFDAHQAHDFLLSLPQSFFAECEIYVTLEPCSHQGKTPSCASLLARLNPKRVIVGTLDPVKAHAGGAKKLNSVAVGVLEEACKELIEPFVIWQERAFVLFKIAQTLNGKIGGGIISSVESRRHVHQLRSVCNRLLIGGNTVRTDRPTLDSRLVGGEAPDVTILSHRIGGFDMDIPLFSVPNRSVDITNQIRWEKCSGFVLVEGGEGMLRSLEGHIDWMLTYTAPKLSDDALSYNINHNLTPLHNARYYVDTVQWSRYSGD